MGIVLSLGNSVYFYQSLWSTIQVTLVILFAVLLYTLFSMDSFAPRFFFCFWGLATLQAIVVIGQRWSNAPYGFFPNNPNWVAGFIGTAFVSLIARLLYSSSPFPGTLQPHNHHPTEGTSLPLQGSVPNVLLPGLLAGLFLFAMLASRSRGALVGTLCAMGYVVMHRWQGRGGLLWMASMLALMAMLPTPLIEQYLKLNFPTPFANQRLAIWGVAARGILDHPFLGYGLGNFEYAYHRHAFPVIGALARYGLTTAFAHNEYLQLATEMGLPALGLLGFGLWKLYGWNTPPPNEKRAEGEGERKTGRQNGGPVLWGIPAKAGLLVLLIQALFDLTFHLPAMVLLGGMLFVIALNRERTDEQPVEQPSFANHASTVLRAAFPRVAAQAVCLTFVLLLASFGTAEVLASQGLPYWAMRINPLKATHWEALAHQQILEFHRTHDPSHFTKTESFLKSAIRRDPSNPALYESLIYFYTMGTPGVIPVQVLRQAQSFDVAQDGEPVEPDGERSRTTGIQSPPTARFRQTLDAYHQAIARSPRNALLYAHLGAFLLQHQEPKRALPYFQEAIRLEPYCFEAHQGIAACYLETQQWRRAEWTLRSLARLKQETEQSPGLAPTGSAYEAHLTQWHPQEFEAAMTLIRQSYE
ncbi:MAG: O-antigen ligase family protein [Elusimicrobia bacterium]|nr:O-antigen ligase family protein [Elusimicrobiota bacterium]